MSESIYEKQIQEVSILRIDGTTTAMVTDQLVMEEPLEVLLEYSNETGVLRKNLAVIMRTPGHDAELAAGFLFTEAVIHQPEAINEFHLAGEQDSIRVVLQENIVPDLQNAERNFYATSACGVCGKSSINAIRAVSIYDHVKDNIVVESKTIFQLPGKLAEQQSVFVQTGGIHACGLFNSAGEMLMMKEDVGRHNALDKLIGAAYMGNLLPLNDHILLLSGRTGFELVQKAAMAGIRFIVSIGAPSSLAVELANEYGITLAGFLRNNRFNIYSGKERILL